MPRLYAAFLWLSDPDRMFRVYVVLLILGITAVGLRLLMA